MAIYSAVPPPDQQPAQAQGVDIESWTVGAMSSLAISASTGATLSIPLDIAKEERKAARHAKRTEDGYMSEGTRKIHVRDSMKRRDALLKGKEGSRRRQRWENGE
jgi:phosphate uptake regulator